MSIDTTNVRKIWHTKDGSGVVFVYDDHVKLMTGDYASLSREDLLSLAAALPGHLQQDAPYVICDYCGRKSWSHKAGEPCRMVTPSGAACAGAFESTTIAYCPSKTSGL